jgi:hypothetical protein
MHEFRLSFWHVLLPVLGLHGLMLAYPIDSKPDLESKLKQGKPVRIVTLPPASQPSVRPVVIKPVTPAAKLKSTLLLQPKRTISPRLTVAKPQVKSQAATPKATPTPLQPPPTPAALQPSPAPTPSVPPASTNKLQMAGATTGCSGSDAQDCFVIAETNGRLAVNQIEAYFQQKGYVLEVQPVEDEHGMIIYKLSKQGHSKDYLHVFWDEKGTTYLRSPKILNHQELALIVRKESS